MSSYNLHHHQGQTHESARVHTKSPDDVVIISALRTPICRAGKGGFKSTHAETLLSAVLKATLEKTGIKPDLIEDLQVGNVLPPGGGATVARMAMFHAGLSEKCSVATVNRQCSSGLQACANIATQIIAGYIDVGIGAGVESMTKNYGSQAMPPSIAPDVQAVEKAAHCLLPMGITSENVAKRFNISREVQDKFSVRSHQLAAKAQKEGLFDEEIIPVVNEEGETITKDDGIRAQTTLEGLKKLKPAFTEDGSTTAGNASQVSDGAAAVLLMRRSVAERLGLKPIARWVGFTSVGVPPDVMGVGPAYAIPKVLQQTGLKNDDISIFEINEAFGSQAVYSVQKANIPIDKVNPKGGAIAFGHPLGCTGARQIATLLPELRRRKARFGVTSMCVGSGMGCASVIENEVNVEQKSKL